MAALEIIKLASEVGALGISIYVIYLFVNGKIMSEHSVKKLTDAQRMHMDDLKAEIRTQTQAWGAKLDEAINLLREIRDNNAMNRRR